MRFEARELKPYQESVRAADLVVGRVYFRVMFADNDMAVPELEALVFIGHDLHREAPGMYYQDVQSYLEGVRFEPKIVTSFPVESGAHGVGWERDGSRFEMEPPGEYSDLTEYDQALDTLLRCSIVRQSWDGVVRRIPGSD